MMKGKAGLFRLGAETKSAAPEEAAPGLKSFGLCASWDLAAHGGYLHMYTWYYTQGKNRCQVKPKPRPGAGLSMIR